MSDEKVAITEALANSESRWRTARWIAKQTGVSVENTLKILERSPEIRRAKNGNTRGEALYALKDKRMGRTGDDVQEPTLGKTHLPPSKLLVLLPFDASARPLRDVVGKVVRASHGEPLFLDEIRPGAVWADEVYRLIGISDAVIADVTRHNPNVMFEIGIAHGLGKPLVLLIDDAASANLPSDLAGYQFIPYSSSNFSPFLDRLGRTIQQVVHRREQR
ncbi:MULTISPECIES: hypothetical protein [Bradyrhizobium]|uniref:hypothetical protein n=1 Tax=Bradyrhizobium TaxID=374 RepID=UPI0011418DF4|nr:MULTISPECIES: hypothetical protein [Bradyrhizobium]UFW51126.1 nucleoside 2-deoxyribosyltransferase [Bradyrhizobium arachidis]